MNTLEWLHTRTGKPMKLIATRARCLIAMMQVRTIYPAHPMMLDGSPV